MTFFQNYSCCILCILLCRAVSYPFEWAEGIDSNEILYSSTNPKDGYYPNIGNGFIAKNVGCYKNTSQSQMNNYNDQIGATPCGSLYMAGVFNGNLSSYVHRARIPGIFSYYIETNPVDKNYNITWLGASLDMKNGIVYNQSIIYHHTKCKNRITIQTNEYTHRQYTYLLVYNISIVSVNNNNESFECEIPLSNCNSNYTIDFKWNEYKKFNQQINQIITLRNMQTLIPTFVNATLPLVSIGYQYIPSNIILNNSNLYQSFYGIFHTSLSYDTNISNQTSLTSLCENELVNTVLMDEVLILNQHKDEMNKLWNIRIDLTGNKTITNSVHSTLYYLFVTLNDKVAAQGISGDGLSSNGYRGTTFWDQDTWDAPSFMLLSPNISIYSTAFYRLNGIYGAMDWLNYCIYSKKIYNYTFDTNPSIQYPWTTAYTGQNTCPLGEGFAYYEQHISSDIGLELKYLFYLTSDKSWFFDLKSQEPDTINPRYQKYSHWNQTNFICNFWKNRFKQRETDKKWTINQIVEPDERAGIVNSGIYTNTAAAKMLDFCIYIVNEYQNEIGNNEYYQQLKTKWEDITNNLFINITNKLTNDSNIFIHSLYNGYSGQNINQADVVMLIYPLGYYLDSQYEFFIMNDTINDILYNDLVYYSSKNGGSNTNPFYTGDSSYSISWLKLNNTLYNKQAQHFFDYGLHHMDNKYYYVWFEEYNAANGGHLNFMTGAGTFLQNIVYGYGGMKVTKDYLYINPILPFAGNITNIRFNQLEYKEIKFEFEFNGDTMSFRRLNESTALNLYVQTLIIDYAQKNITVNQSYEISPTKEVVVNVQEVRLNAY